MRMDLQSLTGSIQPSRSAATRTPAKEKPAYEDQLANVRLRRETMLPALEQLRDLALAGRRLLPRMTVAGVRGLAGVLLLVVGAGLAAGLV